MMTNATVKDIAAALGKSEAAVQKQAYREKWLAVTEKVRGGRERQFIVNLLPVKVRQKVVMAAANERGLVPRDPGQVPATIPVKRPAPPEKVRSLGLAKYNLVHAWRKALKAAPWGTKNEAGEAFLLAYNSGKLLPGIYNQVGEIAGQTLRAMDRKLKKHKDDYFCLCDGRGGWKKYGTTKWRKRALSKEAQYAVLTCYLNERCPSVQLAILAARCMLKKKGIEEPASDGTFRRWLNEFCEKNGHLVNLARYGEKAYTDLEGPHVDRDANLLNVGDVVVADGKVLNFTIVHPETGRPCRMSLIIWIDWRSRYPVGWQIMPTENAIAISAAFRMAVGTLGMIPRAAYMDNGKAFKAKVFLQTDPDLSELTGLYARLGTAVHFALPYRGRSKINERFHLTFQEQCERLIPSYVGASIEDKPAHLLRNEKFHQAWHEAKTKGWIPNLREAVRIIGAYFEWYVRQPHGGLDGQTPLEVFEAGRGPGVDGKALNEELNKEFLWRERKFPRRCRVKLYGVNYESDCLLGIKHKVLVMYDTADMGQVFLYSPEGKFMDVAYPVEKIHPLASEFGDAVGLDRVKFEMSRQRRLFKRTKENLVELGITPKDAIEALSNLPYNEKAPVFRTQPKIRQEPETKPLPESEVKRLELLADDAVAEAAIIQEVAERPANIRDEYERYEWCFYTLFRDGLRLSDNDMAFMEKYETTPDFVKRHKERFDGLKELYAPGKMAVGQSC